METLKELAIRLEHFETPQWAADKILEHELLSEVVIDPCCGTGVLSKAAIKAGSRDVRSFDIHDWGYVWTNVVDFLNLDQEWHCLFTDRPSGATVFMNPPFSLACDFVEKAFELGARKIVCFQRFAWWESKGRREFWDNHPPARIYICGDRATCWRHDLPEEERTSGTTAAHAWFVWERGHPPGTQLHRIYKN